MVCWLVRAELTCGLGVWYVSFVSVCATGPCSLMWWTTSQRDTHPTKTWSLCFSPATPSAVSWLEACLSGSQPWHYSESLLHPLTFLCYVSASVRSSDFCFGFFCFSSSSPVLWATELPPVSMATEWWRLWLCCSHRFPSRCCWWGWSSFAPTQSMRGNLYSSRNSRQQFGEWWIKPLRGRSRHAVFKAAVMEPFTYWSENVKWVTCSAEPTENLSPESAAPLHPYNKIQVNFRNHTASVGFTWCGKRKNSPLKMPF